MPTQDNNGPYPYFWLVILLVIAVIVLLFAKPSPVTQTQTEPKRPVRTQTEPGSIGARPDTYDRLEGLNIDEAVDFLRKRSQRAQQIVPHFPSFPQVWLLPPRERGSYDSIGERYSIEFMELLFPGHRFRKARPCWLKNTLHKTNRCLELDGYCPELCLAIEYNGRQHYEWPNFTGMTWEEFERQRERDQFKAEACIKNNICLIRIPYTVPLERIPLAIYSKLLDSVPGLA
uniref:Uncharacterized protein n=1 Tax=viral metagenome TaxID=1070528 RepID=A0A6C0J1G4_9ZZZZ